MPELAEVELARRIWSPGLDKVIHAVEAHPRTRVFRDTPATEIQSALTSTQFIESHSHGKRLLFIFKQKQHQTISLEVHLGMTGRLSIAAPDHQAHKHDHLILRQKELSLVFNDYRQFGRATLYREPAPWAHLPPEILAPEFTLKHVQASLEQRPRTTLKALLLDQSHFPGIGNWMADEVCWRLGRHPAAPTSSLKAQSLRKEVQFVTRGALQHVADKNEQSLVKHGKGFAAGGYVTKVPPRNWLFQHRWKKGGHCPKCKAELERGTIATRTTAWCPNCQTT